MTDSMATQDPALTELVLVALDDLKAVDPVVIDVRALTSVMDYLVIASGSSSRHVKSLANNVVVEAKAEGFTPIGMEGDGPGEWVLVDFGDIVVHVMQPAIRGLYDLESLWATPATR